MPETRNSSVFTRLADELSQRFVQVLDSMTEQQHHGSWTTADALPAGEVWWRFPLQGGLSGDIWIGATDATAVRLGGSVLAAAGVDSDPETARTTLGELMSQALSATGQSLTAEIGSEVTFGAGCEGGAPDAEPGSASLAIAISVPGAEPSTLSVRLSATLQAALMTAMEKQPSSAIPPPAFLAPPAAPPPAPATYSPTLDLLMEVELPVSISFGRTQLQIKDVMKLSSGSIVELNRSVTEPVEVIVNNCVIARGEVVVIEGNYGVRIDEIISAQERLRTLR